jgi:hypothetical protein
MKEELERNLFKQDAFLQQLNELPKGYLSVCIIDGKSYVYRKRREKDKIVSEYVGVLGDDNVKKAEEQRKQYLDLKESIKIVKKDELRLRKAIKEYERL